MYAYLTAVLARDISGIGDVRPPSGNWTDWFAQELAAYGWHIRDRGAVYYRGESAARAYVEFLSVKEARELYGDCPWFALEHPCPWTHGVIGFVSWANASELPMLSSLGFAHVLVEICWGRVTYLPDFSSREPLVEISIPLSALRKLRYGEFSQDSLLSPDRRYLDAIKTEATNALRRIGIGTPVEVYDELEYGKGVTPIQFVCDEDYPLDDLDGHRMPGADALLEKHFIKFWAYDTKLFLGGEGRWFLASDD